MTRLTPSIIRPLTSDPLPQIYPDVIKSSRRFRSTSWATAPGWRWATLVPCALCTRSATCHLAWATHWTTEIRPPDGPIRYSQNKHNQQMVGYSSLWHFELPVPTTYKIKWIKYKNGSSIINHHINGSASKFGHGNILQGKLHSHRIEVIVTISTSWN